MNQFIDDFFDILFKPTVGMARITKERSVWQGLLVYLAISVVSTITTVGATGTADYVGELSQFVSPEAATAILRSLPVLNVLVILVFTPFLLFISAAILQFSAELLGGRGKGLQLAAGLGYAQLPYILVAPFGLVARYLNFNVVGVVSFVVFIWAIVLKIEAVRAVFGFSHRRAALTYFLPVLAILVATIIFLLLMFSFLMPLMSLLFPIS